MVFPKLFGKIKRLSRSGLGATRTTNNSISRGGIVSVVHDGDTNSAHNLKRQTFDNTGHIDFVEGFDLADQDAFYNSRRSSNEDDVSTTVGGPSEMRSNSDFDEERAICSADHGDAIYKTTQVSITSTYNDRSPVGENV